MRKSTNINKVSALMIENFPVIISWCLILLLFLGLIKWNFRPIHAYLEDRDTAVNEFVIGNNEIIVEEEFETPVPGKKTIKKPMAKNTGRTSCYVRARIMESDSRIKDYLTYYNGEKQGFNQNGWSKDTDGWLYYHTILEVNQNTLPVFTHIQLSEDLPEHLADFSVDVIFESVQSNDFANAKEAFMALGNGGKDAK